MKDDFQTRSKYLASSELEFVNSWKESPLCGDTTFALDPCSLNTFRQSWAERKCSIINSQTFAACHGQVGPAPSALAPPTMARWAPAPPTTARWAPPRPALAPPALAPPHLVGPVPPHRSRAPPRPRQAVWAGQRGQARSHLTPRGAHRSTACPTTRPACRTRVRATLAGTASAYVMLWPPTPRPAWTRACVWTGGPLTSAVSPALALQPLQGRG